MLVIEVQLPHQEEMKKIEWNKEAPTFHELKERVQNCGIPGDWCVEVMRGDNFFSPDDNTEINGARITVRASPIAGEPLVEEENLEEMQWSRWVKHAFDKVTAHIGRVYLCDLYKPEEVAAPTDLSRFVGTVGLMDESGNSICALHTVFSSVEDPRRYKIHIVYPNYHRGRLAFEAKVKNMNEDVDVCVLEPVQRLTKPMAPTTYLDLATDAREGDSVYCFFYPKDPSKHETPKILQKLIRPEKPVRIWQAKASSSSEADHPTVISGNVCFSEWMQGVATYAHLPDSNGGLLVSRSGRVKGVHVKAFTCGELRDFVHSENAHEVRVAKKLSKKMSPYSASENIPVFVPPHGLVRLLGLQGGSELVQAALLQNKVQLKVEKSTNRSVSRFISENSRCKGEGIKREPGDTKLV